MVDRVASDHPSITTVRATVVRHGGRNRRLELPPSATDLLGDRGEIEVIVDERRRVGRCRTVADTPAIVGLYDTNAAAAGDIEGENRLTSTLSAMDRPIGSSVLVDAIDPGRRVGLRPPGQRAIYDAVRTRESSLDAIARDLEDDG